MSDLTSTANYHGPNADEGPDDIRPVTIVHEFPVGSFLANIAVRRNGALLVSINNRNTLVQVDPRNSSSAAATVFTFPGGTSGIVEVEDDVFYVSSQVIGQRNSSSVFRVSMDTFAADASGQVERSANVTKLVDIPEALFLNGAVTADRERGIILLSDSLLGAIFEVNVKSATVSVFLQHAALQKVSHNPAIPGVDGIQIHDGYLYMSNMDSRQMLRTVIGSGILPNATRNVEVVAERLYVDDFAFDPAGNAYVTTLIFNSVVRLTPDGQRSRIAGSLKDTTLVGTTAAAFGRTPADKGSLYVTTEGGLVSPVNNTVRSGKVLRIDVGSLSGC